MIVRQEGIRGIYRGLFPVVSLIRGLNTLKSLTPDLHFDR